MGGCGATTVCRVFSARTERRAAACRSHQHLRIEHVVAPVIAPMAERSPVDALASPVPSWRAFEARRVPARRMERRLPVVAITIGSHRAHVGSAAG
jgi:hypothetical protein